jgi:hypothetical protein
VLASVLLEWLTSRQKLPADWSKRVAAIQAKVKECIKDVPPAVLEKVRDAKFCHTMFWCKHVLGVTLTLWCVNKRV